MKLSAQEEYGLRCLLRLGMQPAQGSLTIAELSRLEGLSAPNVAKMMRLLRRGGLVLSARGKDGGYTLARPADADRGGGGAGRARRAHLRHPLLRAALRRRPRCARTCPTARSARSGGACRRRWTACSTGSPSRTCCAARERWRPGPLRARSRCPWPRPSPARSLPATDPMASAPRPMTTAAARVGAAAAGRRAALARARPAERPRAAASVRSAPSSWATPGRGTPASTRCATSSCAARRSSCSCSATTSTRRAVRRCSRAGTTTSTRR